MRCVLHFYCHFFAAARYPERAGSRARARQRRAKPVTLAGKISRHHGRCSGPPMALSSSPVSNSPLTATSPPVLVDRPSIPPTQTCSPSRFLPLPFPSPFSPLSSYRRHPHRGHSPRVHSLSRWHARSARNAHARRNADERRHWSPRLAPAWDLGPPAPCHDRHGRRTRGSPLLAPG